jgi:hypothetical protein
MHQSINRPTNTNFGSGEQWNGTTDSAYSRRNTVSMARLDTAVADLAFDNAPFDFAIHFVEKTTAVKPEARGSRTDSILKRFRVNTRLSNAQVCLVSRE